MNICFVGVGSIAERHIRNIKTLLGETAFITVVRSGKGKALSPDAEACIDCIKTQDDADGLYDAVFVTNPTSLHYDTLVEWKDKSKNFFIEKPVFLTGDERIELFEKDNRNYYIACPLRYTAVLEYVKKQIHPGDVVSARAICSSYLPEWRPGEDYRNTYSSKKAMGGGVSIDLIHEWDYLTWLFGLPRKVKRLITKKSNLEIDCDDTALYLAEFSKMTAEIHLDYFGRAPIRKLELFTLYDTIEVDLLRQRVFFMKENKVVSFEEGRDDYQKRELQHFLDIVAGKESSDNDLHHACAVLKIARG